MGEDNTWKKSDVLTFKPVINDVSKKYNIVFTFRHVHGFPFRDVKIALKIKSPSGDLSVKEYSIAVFNDKNEYISKCAGDYCDLDQVVEQQYSFTEKGTYVFEISHEMTSDPLRNVMEVGLIIKQAN